MTNAMKVSDATSKAAALNFADDPVSYFDGSHTAMQTIERTKLFELQRSALQARFEQLSDRIPMLNKLASRQGISSLESVDDVVPLLFEHTMYKSYPPALLEAGRFSDLTHWLSKLTVFDFSKLDVSKCESIDEWLDVMDEQSPLKICHSSGTSGTMSFLPTSHSEWDKYGRMQKATILQEFGEDPQTLQDEVHCVFPFYRTGGSSHLRGNDNLAKYIAGDESRFFAAFPGRMSSDVLYLSARIRAAQARGDLERLKINPNLLARKKEFEAVEAAMPALLDNFFDETIQRLKGKRVFIGGTWNLLHGIARKGLDRGLENVFAQNSIAVSGGGAKGMTPPENWQEDVCSFYGVSRIRMQYGMSEVMGLHEMCDHGHYHFVPWVIPFVLDPETSRPFARTGVTTGRAAFFDLGAETRWGGFISGDEITVHWDGNCPCGRTSTYAEGTIQRYSEKNGGDDKITCAATESAHTEAMTFLNNFE